MSIERPGQRSLLQSTIVPVNDGTANQPRDNCEPAQAVYVSRIGNLARARYQLPIAKPGVTFAAYREWFFAMSPARATTSTRARASLAREDGLSP